MILLRAETFVNIQKSLQHELGDEETLAVFYEAGIEAGCDSVKALLDRWTERGMPFLERWGKFYESDGVGWFHLDHIGIDMNTGLGKLVISQSFIADKYGSSTTTVCDFLCGFFIGVLKEILGVELTCQEVECEAKGNSQCVFEFEKV